MLKYAALIILFSPSVFAQDTVLRLEPLNFGFKVINVSRGDRTVTGAQLNYRDDCLLSSTSAVVNGIKDFHLADPDQLRASVLQVYGEAKASEVVIKEEPVVLRPGELVVLNSTETPCNTGKTELFAITIYTDLGEVEFKRE